MLTAPMRARFGIEQRLNYYPVEALELIVHRTAEVLKVPIDKEGAARDRAPLARHAARRQPAPAPRARLRAGEGERPHRPRAVAAQALFLLDVDQFGLDDMDARVLKAIIEKFDGGPVGISTIAAAVGEDAGTIEGVYEPFLVQNGFLQRTPRGRMATSQAYRHFGFQPPAASAQASLDV